MMNIIEADRYILGVSGGKDSAALAVYMSQEFPHLDIEYFFTDTGEELDEVYEFLDRLEIILQKKIVRLGGENSFEDYLKKYNYFLPNAQQRWCTSKLKILPLEKWLRPDLLKGKRICSFVAIRADEPYREGQVSKHENYFVDLPFRHAGINKKEVHDLLESSGIGKPAYYEWRSRSGCTFCFFQRKIEWVGLMERNPEAFEKAKRLEQKSLEKGSPFTWLENEKLEDLEKPERIAQIRKNHDESIKRAMVKMKINPLNPQEYLDDDDFLGQSKFCITCHK